MKKFYAVVALMLVATFCFAQNLTPKQAHQFDGKKMIVTDKHMNAAKNEAGSMWFTYPALVEEYWGLEGDFRSYPLQLDTNGLMFPSNSDPWHPNVCGWGQTYDFSNQFYDDVLGEGAISLANTSTYSLDSIMIHGGYFRGSQTPANSVDTMIVGVLTTVSEDQLMSLSTADVNPIINFYAVDYDPATGVQLNAIVYKFPLTANDVSETTEDGSYYSAALEFPIGLNNISNKVLHIAYAYKRGYDVGLNDTLMNHSYFAAWIYSDPRSNYCPYQNGWTQFIDNDNMNQGGTIDSDTRFDIGVTPDSWSYRIYTPSSFWNELHYPYMYIKVSCDDCAIVNVEDMEKENITVYPNPATNNITVNTGSEEKALVEMFNLVGQKVYSENVVGTTTINVSNMKAGVYMLRVNNHTTKVVVK